MQDKPVAWSPGATKELVFKSRRIWRRTAAPCSSDRATAKRERRQRRVLDTKLASSKLDVTNQASITAAAERIRNEFGRLDVFVNNAGISHVDASGWTLEEAAKSGRASVVSLNEVIAVFETNVFGVISVTQAMLPLLR